jgi:hypothetical protein
MKKTHIILLTSILFLSSSCSEWLDVKPQSILEEAYLFSDKESYDEALRGIYVIMRDFDLYGDRLTLSTLDILAQNYKLRIDNIVDIEKVKFVRFDYNTNYADKIFTEIWSKQFNAIANCNNLIKNITKKSSKEIIGRKHLYDRLYGETLALRAFLHFDLLRMFHPSYKSNKEYKAMPYIKKFDNSVSKSKPQSTQEILNQILDDLTQSYRLLLKTNDKTIVRRGGGRIDYYAVTGLLARVYLYKGDTQKALKYAKEIIGKSKILNFSNDGAPTDFSNQTLFFLNFQDYHLSMKKKIDTYFPIRIQQLYNVSFLFCNEDKIKKLYTDKNDIRYKYLFTHVIINQKKQRVLKKYRISLDIPILKLSEIYLIAAECSANTDLTKAIFYLHKFQKEGRNIKKMPTITDKNALMEEITREYQREFIGEGQLFYFYKRINKPSIKSYKNNGTTIEMNKDKYTFPVPKAENKFWIIKKKIIN